MYDFASNPPLPHFALGVGFSIWNHANICFREMKNTCAKFGPDPSENEWFCINPPLPHFGPRSWFSKWNSASICFRGIKNNVTNLVQIRRKVHDLDQSHPYFPILAPGLVFRYETMPVFISGGWKYTCQVWSKSVEKCVIWIKPTPSLIWFRGWFSKWNHPSICFRVVKNIPDLVQIRREVHDFASTTSPFPTCSGPWGWLSLGNHASIYLWAMKSTCSKYGADPSENAWFCTKPTPLHLALGVGLSMSNHASIYFRVMKNTYAKFSSVPSENEWFWINPTHSPIWPPELIFRNETLPQFICFRKKKVIFQVWSRSIGKCLFF